MSFCKTSQLFVSALFYLLITSTLTAGYLNENFRVGIDFYSYQYSLSQKLLEKYTNSNLSTLGTMRIEYDSHHNYYGEGEITLGNNFPYNNKTKLGFGYYLSPQVSIGSNILISQYYQSAENRKNTQTKNAGFDLIVNPYSRIIFKINSRTHIHVNPGVLITYLTTTNKSQVQSDISKAYEENKTFPLVSPSTKLGESAKKSSYLGFGMSLLTALNIEIARDIFYRSSIGVNLISGQYSPPSGANEKKTEVSHFNVEVSFAKLLYQF